ncbi:hypothetical protein [Lysinibacillus sp. UGB7]|uniref:hypothetical protein n=1 Tax=Lysinibacillus sp. UGB7 TaxID=3411039 RepID=UPI003BA012ED
MKLHVQSRKIASIIYPLNREKDEILLAELMPAINLMIQVERGLRKGVPISHVTIQSAVFSINDIVEKALDNYYSVSLLDLNMELRLAKEIQIEYQKRREKWIEDTKAFFEPAQINKSIE